MHLIDLTHQATYLCCLW